MSALEDLPGTRTMQLERVLPGPVERVWRHLTEPELLEDWLDVVQLEPREGGAVHVRSRPEAPGTVTRCEPPRVLTLTWSDSPKERAEVTFELHPAGEEVRLVVTHRHAQLHAEARAANDDAPRGSAPAPVTRFRRVA